MLDYQHLSLPEISSAAGVGVGFDTLVVHESYPVDADSLTSAAPADTGDPDAAETGSGVRVWRSPPRDSATHALPAQYGHLARR